MGWGGPGMGRSTSLRGVPYRTRAESNAWPRHARRRVCRPIRHINRPKLVQWSNTGRDLPSTDRDEAGAAARTGAGRCRRAAACGAGRAARGTAPGTGAAGSGGPFAGGEGGACPARDAQSAVDGAGQRPVLRGGDDPAGLPGRAAVRLVPHRVRGAVRAGESAHRALGAPGRPADRPRRRADRLRRGPGARGGERGRRSRRTADGDRDRAGHRGRVAVRRDAGRRVDRDRPPDPADAAPGRRRPQPAPA